MIRQPRNVFQIGALGGALLIHISSPRKKAWEETISFYFIFVVSCYVRFARGSTTTNTNKASRPTLVSWTSKARLMVLFKILLNCVSVPLIKYSKPTAYDDSPLGSLYCRPSSLTSASILFF